MHRNEYNIPASAVLDAYRKGLFPMAENANSKEIYWIEPKKRGGFFFYKIREPRKLKKIIKNKIFNVAIDNDFEAVIEHCAKKTENRKDTWINNTIKKIYIELHNLGCAHSVECYFENELVGGLYGIEIGGTFFGESMFSKVSNSSKVALIHLIERLIKGGFDFLDTQFINEHLKQFGAVELSNDEFKKILTKSVTNKADFFSFSPKGYLPDNLYPNSNSFLL